MARSFRRLSLSKVQLLNMPVQLLVCEVITHPNRRAGNRGADSPGKALGDSGDLPGVAVDRRGRTTPSR
jgi:hypothetical protein